ncbi:unnamed protein product [Prunus armeniaca]|uniref:Tryptophan synthase beta chain-like PALP domain-containing protein n=1 Tax=Prunus armeniaca TaxID=36596 RepID=A0A6J5VMT9_PRUAR|nr:unnamed protein product [Prunus armeniaca]
MRRGPGWGYNCWFGIGLLAEFVEGKKSMPFLSVMTLITSTTMFKAYVMDLRQALIHAKGLGYGINTSEELKFVTEIAATTGIVLDPVYSGKATYGMLKDMAENTKMWEGRKILFIHIGGLLGLFDKAEQMAPSLGNWRRMDVQEYVPRSDGIGKMF